MITFKINETAKEETPQNKIGLHELRAELRDVINYFDFAESFVSPDVYSCEVHECCQAIVNVCQVCMFVLNNELNEPEEDFGE